ncbi:uncharacterized protein LOC120280256 isoform X2 [Dioscorea cayenensis subsp. rotundata]|uniref:Uncharacterized protein LOC120280256 isoform X2 n=1 Tax=Dioscorea cayennensis subsp. rotundata TaxID=55577 RepID=A0AB40CU69_DIOCR|nr:uncharacterized protein LOC120280256 isoform X2 [Dioscorea cayenensis subsp. rotundata]
MWKTRRRVRREEETRVLRMGIELLLESIPMCSIALSVSRLCFLPFTRGIYQSSKDVCTMLVDSLLTYNAQIVMWCAYATASLLVPNVRTARN